MDEELREDLRAARRDGFDVVAFTHLDDDHIHGASEFFWLEHAAKYQGEGRAKIAELWVPAAAITEEGLTGEARVIRSEARHRLKMGTGIRVFSRPERLRKWLEDNGLKLEDRAHLITDAGRLVPGYTTSEHGVEFFAHSPFAWRQDDGTLEDRNGDCIVVQAHFLVADVSTKLMLAADAPYDVLEAIVQATKRHKNQSRLEWDIFKLPHHCSYTALGPERGKTKTEPVPDVAWLFETQGLNAGIIVSTSKPIPVDDSDSQPPHRQAAAYYGDVVGAKSGQFKVTMEYPTVDRPKPLVIEIDKRKATVKKEPFEGAAAVLTSRAPRAGGWGGR